MTMTTVDRQILPELISIMTDMKEETAYINPQFSQDVLHRLERIYDNFATTSVEKDDANDYNNTKKVMGKSDVEQWLTIINQRVGRGSEFRTAAKFMGWVDPAASSDDDSKPVDKSERPPITIPDEGVLSLESFIGVYLDELRQGKFWGIAWDLATLGEPLPVKDVFGARYDRMYCSSSLRPVAVLDTVSDAACPNGMEPSDHLPVCASFVRK
mmetsp:Transcript_23895/g.50667  ORF Transcript_23895/g.50667 Transcript_23895/m.50667 type:complete len:213 (+) Transcript_23895:621-1259(+)